MNLANRAASAETAVTQRHLRRLWALPGTQLAVVAWPSTRRDRLFGSWHYWWQAHLLDCLVDAQLRDPQPQRRARINRQVRSHRVRNNFSWLNSYYDDMAWLALALERADRVAGVRRRRALPKLTNQFVEAWVPEDGGGIRGASRTSSSTPQPTARPGYSWPATQTSTGKGSSAQNRWPTGSIAR